MTCRCSCGTPPPSSCHSPDTWHQSDTRGFNDMIFIWMASTCSKGRKQDLGLDVAGRGLAVAPAAVMSTPPLVTRSSSRLVLAMLDTNRMTAWLGWGEPTCLYWG